MYNNANLQSVCLVAEKVEERKSMKQCNLQLFDLISKSLASEWFQFHSDFPFPFFSFSATKQGYYNDVAFFEVQ